MPAADEYEQMIWLLRRFMRDNEAADLFEERFQRVQSAFETLAPDPFLAPHVDEYRRLVRTRSLWRRGARLDQQDSDFDVREYRPQTYALVHESVEVARLRGSGSSGRAAAARSRGLRVREPQGGSRRQRRRPTQPSRARVYLSSSAARAVAPVPPPRSPQPRARFPGSTPTRRRTARGRAPTPRRRRPARAPLGRRSPARRRSLRGLGG